MGGRKAAARGELFGVAANYQVMEAHQMLIGIVAVLVGFVVIKFTARWYYSRKYSTKKKQG